MTSPVITWPAPLSEPASPDYQLTVADTPVFVYQARVRADILQHPGLWTHERECGGERAAFAIFDMREPVTVTITAQQPITSALVLPARAGITPVIRQGAVQFTLSKAMPVTVLCNGSAEHALHLFAGEPEQDAPSPDDPHVVYFGPGVHEITGLTIQSGQTVYLAGGAIVKAKLRSDEPGKLHEKFGIMTYGGDIFNAADTENVRIGGRGILDGSAIPHIGKTSIRISNSRHVQLSGITLRDASNWNVCLSGCADVQVDDLRIISGRLNSDGINSTNSRDVTVRRCFVRNHDDSIAVKSPQTGRPCEKILVEDCVIWADWGYALGATYETRQPIRNIRFRRCDVLAARHWVLGIHVSDSATISDLHFEDIAVADLWMAGKRRQMPETPQLIRFIIMADMWGKDSERGHIRDVVIDGVTVDGDRLPPSEFFGCDAEHQIENVVVRNVRLRGQAPVADLAGLGAQTNAFVRELVVQAR